MPLKELILEPAYRLLQKTSSPPPIVGATSFLVKNSCDSCPIDKDFKRGGAKEPEIVPDKANLQVEDSSSILISRAGMGHTFHFCLTSKLRLRNLL